MTLYEVLGVAPDATPEQIKKAYQRLAMKYHPDRMEGGDDRHFKKIQGAYEVLSDPERRELYDATGETEKPKMDAAETLVSQLFAGAVDNNVKGDLIEQITKLVKQASANMNNEILKARTEVEKLARYRGRIKRTDDGDNISAY